MTPVIEKKGSVIGVWLHAEERKVIEEAAKGEGRSVSAWARRVLMAAVGEPGRVPQ